MSTFSVLCYFMGVKLSLWCNPQRIFYRGWIWYFNETFSKITSQLSSLLSLISLFTYFLSCLSLTTKLAFFGFLSSTKMAFRKSLTWVPTFLVILLLASIPFLQSSRTRELVSSLSLSLGVVFYFLLMHIFTIQCAGFQGGTTMPENTAELMRQVYIYFDHKKHVKVTIFIIRKIPFLLLFFHCLIFPMCTLYMKRSFSKESFIHFIWEKGFQIQAEIFGNGGASVLNIEDSAREVPTGPDPLHHNNNPIEP